MTQQLRAVGMPTFLRASTILVAAATLLVLAAPIATAQDAFTGTWTSTDLDGSNQTLWIGGSGQAGRHSVTYYDDAASQACGGAPARTQGSGAVEGDTLFTGGTITCPGTGRGPTTGRVGLFAFTYDDGTDTLIGDDGVVWERAG